MAYSLRFKLPEENNLEKQNPPGEADIRISGLANPHAVTIEGYDEDGWVRLASFDAVESRNRVAGTVNVPPSRRVRASVSSGGRADVMFLD